jgi:hypothetical protein
VQACDETRETVTIVVPVDPTSAIHRLIVDAGVPPPVDRSKRCGRWRWPQAPYPPTWIARTLQGKLAIRRLKPLDRLVETNLCNVSVISGYLLAAGLFKAKAGGTFHFFERTSKYESASFNLLGATHADVEMTRSSRSVTRLTMSGSIRNQAQSHGSDVSESLTPRSHGQHG